GDEGRFSFRVSFPIELKFLSEFQLQRGVICGQLRVGAEEVSELEAVAPKWAAVRNEVKVMGPQRKRWLAEPMHDIGLVFGVLVAGITKGSFCRLRFGKRWHADHEVDDRFCTQARDGGASDVLDWASTPGAEKRFEKGLLLFEFRYPAGIV